MSLQSLQNINEITLRHDINFLLYQFNQVDYDDSGLIPKDQLTQLFFKLKIYPKQKLENQESKKQFNQKNQHYEHEDNYNEDDNYLEDYYLYRKNDQFDFEGLLSLLGEVQHPNEPALYVLSFIKVLAGYRNKCIQKQEPIIQHHYLEQSKVVSGDQGLKEAKEIDIKIRKIIKKQLERQKQRMLNEHKKIYEEMQKSQRSQYDNFENQWIAYLEQFQIKTHDKLQKTRKNKLKELSFQSERVVKTARRNSLTTSPKLQQLIEKKKWLVKQGRYSDAIKINHLIQSEKNKIHQHHQDSLDFTLRKRINSLKKKNHNALEYMQSQLKTNMGRLLSKKKQGQNLMKIRMKNLQDEAHRKLNDHLKSQLSRLRASFGRAAR